MTRHLARLRARLIAALIAIPGIGALLHLVLHTAAPILGLPCP